MSRQPQRSYASKTCAWCSGTGNRDFSGGHVISCLVCGGKGHISVIEPAEECQQCAGSGKRNATNPCMACAGTGWTRFSRQV